MILLCPYNKQARATLHWHSRLTMNLHHRAYKNLSPKTRMGVGVGVIAWGVVGLYLSDTAEEKLGYTPSEQDKEDLWKWAPKVTTVDRKSADEK